MEYENKIDYVPVPKQHQLIVPYDFKLRQYAFTENDLRLLLKYIKKGHPCLDASRSDKVKKSQSLQKLIQKTLKVALWCIHLIFLMIFVYLWIGVLLFLLADPVILVLYGYLVIYKLWYKGMRLVIEIVLDYGKSRPLQNYLKSMNKTHFGSKGIQWGVGGGGKWIQIDYLKHLKK